VFDAAVELLAGARRPLRSRTRVRVHLGTAEVLGRVVQLPELDPGARGLARFVLERPLVARAGDRFVIRSFSPVTTIGGGIVLDPFPPPRPSRLRQRRLAAGQTAPERLLAWIDEAGLGGVPQTVLPVRLGIVPGEVPALVTEAGKPVLQAGEVLVARTAIARAADGLAAIVERHHAGHPLDPGMSLQELRATLSSAGTSSSGGGRDVPAAVIELVIQTAVKKHVIEIEGSVARRPGWKPDFGQGPGGSRDELVRHITEARWQIPTVGELERDFPRAPVRALLAHLVRDGGVERVGQEHFASREALDEFRAALEAALREAGPQTPAQLRERFGLTRKYLIPLLEWADRRGITLRQGDTRILPRA
jgi:selenocysteine-specific elongation factor